MEQIILLNADYTFLNIINWKRAIKLLVKEKVEVIKNSEKVIRCLKENKPIPKIIRLLYMIQRIYKNTVPFSRKNIFIRDGHRCMYIHCWNHKDLTIDHIIPKSRGGKTTFENCVTCCRLCNWNKGNRTPSEAGMKLREQPRKLTIIEYLLKKAGGKEITEYIKSAII